MRYVSTTLSDSLSVNGIFTVFKPNLARPNVASSGEAHNFPEILYLERGRHIIVIDGEEHELATGQIIIYAPGSYHSSKGPSDSTASIISFDLNSPMISEISNRAITLSERQKNMFSSIIDDGLKCFEKRAPGAEVGGMILKADANEYTLQRIKKQLEFFIIDVYNTELSDATPARSKEEFLSATEFLETNIDSQLSLADIAAGCSMSVSKLKILFRKNYGSGPIDCFIEMKINNAKQLIKKERLNLTEISEALGFSSIHYFSRIFKKKTGITPSEYKRLQIEQKN